MQAPKNKYNYLDPINQYTLKNGVLRNLPNIEDEKVLLAYESLKVSNRIEELFDNPIRIVDSSALLKIHKHLFQDVYEWAGEVRSVDIIRGDSRFCNVRQIQSYSHTIFSGLSAEKYLVNLEPTVFANRLAHYLSEVNAIHPFREGNGRVQRLFISQLAEHAGYSLDYSALDQAELYPVMQASFLGDERPLSELILKIIA